MFWNGDRLNRLWEDPRLARWKNFFHRRIVRHIEKCDFSRYAILYLYGGVYCDLDMICLRPLDPLMEGRELGLAYQPYEHCLPYEVIANQFMASSPGHWFWPMLMNYIMRRYDTDRSVLYNTGTAIIARLVRENRIRYRFPEFFIPTCLVVPKTFFGKISANCPENIMDRAYCYTKWNEGTGWIRFEKLAEERSIAKGYMPICLTNPFLSIIVYIVYNKIRHQS
jgi:mannosyltransferase OCH1-like enzyme